MIALEDLLHRLKGLDRRELTRWVENRWVLPERRNDTWIFHEVDVARVELIREIRDEAEGLSEAESNCPPPLSRNHLRDN